MKKIIKHLSWFAIVIFMTSCINPKKELPKNFDYGKVANNIYSNSFFGLKMEIPQDWHVQSQKQTEQLTKMGKELFAGDNNDLKATLSAAEVNSANLLTVFKHEVGAAVEFNPNFVLVAENLKNAPGIKSGKDYLFHSSKLLKQSQVQYSHIDSEFEIKVIGGKDFYTMRTRLSFMDVSIEQVYYSTVINGFCFSAIISFGDEDQKSMLSDVINSMQLQ